MRAFSIDLRERIVFAYENGEGTLDEIAELFAVSRRSVARLLQQKRESGSLEPRPHGGGCPKALDEAKRKLLRRQVAQRSDATLVELQAYLQTQAQTQVHVSTVCRALQHLGLGRKKKPEGYRAQGSRTEGVP